MDPAFAPYTWRQNNNAAAKQIFLIALLFDLGVGKVAHSFDILIKTLFQCVAIAFQYVAIIFALLSQQAIALRHFCCHLAIIGFLFHFLGANGVCFNYFL